MSVAITNYNVFIKRLKTLGKPWGLYDIVLLHILRNAVKHNALPMSLLEICTATWSWNLRISPLNYPQERIVETLDTMISEEILTHGEEGYLIHPEIMDDLRRVPLSKFGK